MSAIEADRQYVMQACEPQPFWKFFEDLSAIPRGSYNEKAALDFLKRFADDRGLPWKQDAAGNVVVRRKGMNGGEGAATVVIQGHVDIVAEKNVDSKHDFAKDPLRLMVDGDWLTADGTTLGADNGVGVAAALALLDMPTSSGMTLPPLECLFTIEEEVGLCGAMALDESLISGRTMLNLDTGDWGTLYIGCAGGGTTSITLPADDVSIDPAAFVPYRVTVDGLLGGHSGATINEYRANAIVLMARVVSSLVESIPATRVVSITGGDKHNSIPREAFATVLLPKGDVTALNSAKETVKRLVSELRFEFGRKDTMLSVRFGEEATETDYSTCLSEEALHRLLSLLQLLPHGVVKMSHDLPGLVETSNNLASLVVSHGAGGEEGPGQSREFKVLCSTRSSLAASVEQVRRQINAAAKLCGAQVEQPLTYPGWRPDLDSTVLQVTKESMRKVLGDREPKVAALHAGLECGVIGDKLPGMDMVSFGPMIVGNHTPDEKVEIASVAGFWKVVVATLEGLVMNRIPQ